MRSRAFFFTAVTCIGVSMIIGIGYLWQHRSRIFTDSSTQNKTTIRINRTVKGTVTEAPTGATITTIKDEVLGQELHVAIIPETTITDEKGEEVTIAYVRRGSVVEVRGESTATNIVVAGEIRVLSTPNFVITTPTAQEPITSPVTITGEATGSWYFEATFPVTITDAYRKILGQHYVTATKDWMSESLVPFTTELTFATPTTGTGFLIFKNANPSGLPEYEKTLEMPITFGTQVMRVKVFFNNSKLDPAFVCDKVFPSTREIPWTAGVGRAAIEALLKGPSEAEKSADYFTNINPNVRINTLVIENGIARIDLSEELDRNIGGSCRVTAIRAQITETLKQFSTVQDVIISINGRTEDILQP